MKKLLLCTTFAIVWLVGCGSTPGFDEIPISPVFGEVLREEVKQYRTSLERIQFIIENPKLSPRQKIQTLARDCSIRDLNTVFWYLNLVEPYLGQEVLRLHTARELFAAKMKKLDGVSFECVEAAMLAAAVLREKKIEAYVLLIHGFNFESGHAVCIYRTPEGWGTLGVNITDFVEPIGPLDEFKEELNRHIRETLLRNTTNADVRLYSICHPDELHDDFVDGEGRRIFWTNFAKFFSSAWY